MNELSVIEPVNLQISDRAAAAEAHPVTLYLARLGKRSRRVMLSHLNRTAEFLTNGRATAQTLPWGDLQYSHSVALRAALEEAYAPSTANTVLSAYRGVLREAWRSGVISAEQFHRVTAVENIRSQRLPAGRALSSGELRALFHVCWTDESPAGARDAAMLATLYGAGLRRSEAVGLDLADVRLEEDELRVRSGKGRKDRLTFLPSGGQRAMERWLDVRGTEPGPLFLPINKGGALKRRRMTHQAVWGMLRKRANQAGIAKLSPHDLRRTFISDLLDAGADIATVQRLAGHAQVTTTARYDRRGEQTKRKAAKLLHIPAA